MTRNYKRLIIIAVYLVIFFLVGLLIYQMTKPAPTCFDGKKNQREEGTDCGGPCAPCKKVFMAQPLAVAEKAFIYGGPGRYDVMTKISNPNSEYGSPDFSYEFILKDSSGKEIDRRSGKGFILPAETKYIIESNLEAVGPQEVEVIIASTEWAEFSNYEKPRLDIYNKRYNLISGGVGYSEAYGLLRNDSPFDFNFIKINVILRDSGKKPVALNSTDMRTVNSREQRDFRLLWPFSFPGEVEIVEMEAEADVYNSQNFIKQYLPGGKFQEY
ncbi:MAG: hypothetical protein NT136_01655 [Candidatus Moranbacteria bacterium]|nr:hypothetical protein [Candidatus Moranbacteria bacterium]